MWLSILITCGWLDGVEHCTYVPPIMFDQEELCRLTLVKDALAQLKEAEEQGFEVSSGWADCRMIEIGSETF